MVVTVFQLMRISCVRRVRAFESARALFLSRPQIPSSREDGPMLHNGRGLLLSGVAAFALLFVGATAAHAQDAVVRGTISSDRGEPISGANVVIDELRLAVPARNRRCCCAARRRSTRPAAARIRSISSTV